ncbi:TPA: cadherin-like domain-containing protein, partial [Candidatus Gracilibacteria bacterium]|nr:cadherin-like domain-containing protein [Candidatus Gracilibacteria bacterium]
DNTATNDSTVSIIDVLSNDTDADANILIITNLSIPTHGTAVIENGKVKYTPESGYVGTATFTYTPNDGYIDGNVTTVTVAITITPSTYDNANYDEDSYE